MESSSINAPHPDDPDQEAAAFFGPEPDAENGVAAEEPPADPGDFQPPDFEDDDPSAPAEGQPAPASEEADPTPAEPDGATGSTTDGVQSAPTRPPSEPQSEKARGSISRQYIVLHKLPLTERVLQHLLDELKSGDRGGEPRYGYFELHQKEARNANEAITDAYMKHHERIGDAVDLVAISEKAFQKRHVEPRQKVQTNIAIT